MWAACCHFHCRDLSSQLYPLIHKSFSCKRILIWCPWFSVLTLSVSFSFFLLCFPAVFCHLVRSPTATSTTQCFCWPTPSTGSWRTGNGTAWRVFRASARAPNPGRVASLCWIPWRRYSTVKMTHWPCKLKLLVLCDVLNILQFYFYSYFYCY